MGGGVSEAEGKESGVDEICPARQIQRETHTTKAAQLREVLATATTKTVVERMRTS
jgi:hypothetical protein